MGMVTWQAAQAQERALQLAAWQTSKCFAACAASRCMRCRHDTQACTPAHRG